MSLWEDRLIAYLESFHFLLYIGAQCDVVLLARNSAGLRETKSKIATVAPGINVHIVEADLQDLHSLGGVFDEVAKAAYDHQYQQYVLIHDAGSLGDITKPMIEQPDPSVIQEYFAINFTSMFTLTAHFLSHFPSGHRTVVNITTLLASQYMPSFSLYSSSRAARNAFMGVLAVENPDVRVLSYSPGPCDTEMFHSIPQQSFSQEVVEGFRSTVKNNQMLSCQQSVSKLSELLKEDKFKNGSVIDYYDEQN